MYLVYFRNLKNKLTSNLKSDAANMNYTMYNYYLWSNYTVINGNKHKNTLKLSESHTE